MGAGASSPTLSYEALDVMKMELPPGWRGYGAKDHIDHPETARRAEEIAAIEAREADRIARQDAALPFKQLLPECFRPANARYKEAEHG